MRNWFDTGCDCSNPEPIVGAIVGGKKYPFGTVKQSDYNADMEEVNNHFTELDERVADNKKAHDIDISNINQKISQDEKKLESVASNVLRNNDEISELKAITSALNMMLKGLATRTDNIEDKLNDVSAKVSDNDVRLSTVETKYQSTISNINANIRAITDVMENLDARVTALEKGPEPEPVPPVKKFYVYWGASPAAVPNTAVVSGLQYSVYTDEVTRTITVPCNDEYCYYCIPKSEGQVQFEVSGFTGGFENPVEVGVVDAEGKTEMYYVYRSSQLLDGTAPIRVKR